jgi:hypothetical protein
MVSLAGAVVRGLVTSTTVTVPGGIDDATVSAREIAAGGELNRIVLALFGLALLLVVLGWWYARATRPLAPALEGLAVVGRASFRHASPERRRAQLDRVRRRRGQVPDVEAEPVVDDSGEPEVLPLVSVAPADVVVLRERADRGDGWAVPAALCAPDIDAGDGIPSEPWPTASTSTR